MAQRAEQIVEAMVRWTQMQEETEEDTRRRKHVLALLLTCLVFAVCIVPVAYVVFGFAPYFVVTAAGGVAVFAFAGAVACVRMRAIALANGLICLLTGIVLSSDFGMVMEEPGSRTWIFMVVLADLSLVLNMSSGCVGGVFGAAVVWQVLMASDRATVGLVHEVRGWDVWDSARVPAVCDCSSPPCTQPAAISLVETTVALFTFAVDFYFTRGFAREMRSRIEVVDMTVLLAQRITKHLSLYEVDEAQEVVDAQDTDVLPPELREAQRVLIENLRKYKGFLPMSCLERRGSEESEQEQSPPSDSPADDKDEVVEPLSPHPTCRPRRQSHAYCGMVPRRKRASLVCLNHRGFLSQVQRESVEEIGSWVAAAVGQLEECVVGSKGVVDHLQADHFFVSFNAVRPCGAHRLTAVRFGFNYIRRRAAGSVSSAATSDLVVCGDFGTGGTLRFMVLHQCTSLLLMLERAAAAWHVEMLVDQTIQADASSVWHCRLRTLARYPRKYAAARLPVWQVVRERMQANPEAREWMYQLMTLEPDAFERLNDAVLLWCCGDRDAAVQAAQEAEEDSDLDVCDAARSVSQAVQTGKSGVVEFVECTAAPCTPGVCESIP